MAGWLPPPLFSWWRYIYCQLWVPCLPPQFIFTVYRIIPQQEMLLFEERTCHSELCGLRWLWSLVVNMFISFLLSSSFSSPLPPPCRNPPTSASQVLVLKTCTSTPCLNWLVLSFLVSRVTAGKSDSGEKSRRDRNRAKERWQAGWWLMLFFNRVKDLQHKFRREA